MQSVPQIRIFLASPGDVNEERAIALEVMDMLEYDRLFRRDGVGGVSLHAIAWDKPGGDVPMRITKTPQTAIKEGLPRPSDCDVVLVLFWSRMGTPLPHPEYEKADGSPYLSGTEWEFWDAVNAERAHGRPITLIYRRTEKPDIDIDDEKALDQYRAVRRFFDQFRDESGAIVGGVNEYLGIINCFQFAVGQSHIKPQWRIMAVKKGCAAARISRLPATWAALATTYQPGQIADHPADPEENRGDHPLLHQQLVSLSTGLS